MWADAKRKWGCRRHCLLRQPRVLSLPSSVAAATAATAAVVIAAGVVVIVAATALSEQEHDDQDQDPSAGVTTKETAHFCLPPLSDFST